MGNNVWFENLFWEPEQGDPPAQAQLYRLCELSEAAEKKQYRKLYSILEKMGDPLPFDWVDENFGEVAQNVLLCSARAFGAVLGRSSLGERDLAYLLVRAAELDRPDHLALVLDRLRKAGGNVKRAICGPAAEGFGTMSANALAAAVENRNLRCVRRLLRAPEAEPVWSLRLLELWAEGGTGDEALDRCLEAVARAWMPGCMVRGGPLPLAPGMKLEIALERDNPVLARRIFQAGGAELPEVRKAFAQYGGTLARPAFHGLLRDLLTAWPQLLRSRMPAVVLVLAILLPEEMPIELEPWRKRLQRRARLPLQPFMGNGLYCQYYQNYEEPWTDEIDWRWFLERWQQRLGPRPVPVLLRSGLISDWNLRENWPVFLEFCEVWGPIPQNRASMLAWQLVQCGSLKQVRQALKPGGILEGENLGYLLKECTWGSAAEARAKRAALLARAR